MLTYRHWWRKNKPFEADLGGKVNKLLSKSSFPRFVCPKGRSKQQLASRTQNNSKTFPTWLSLVRVPAQNVRRFRCRRRGAQTGRRWFKQGSKLSIRHCAGRERAGDRASQTRGEREGGNEGRLKQKDRGNITGGKRRSGGG